MNAPIRVMLTADPDLPVPPRLYGGIERIIALLAEGLASRGHDVTLVARGDSTVGVRVVPYRCEDSSASSALINALEIAKAVRRHRPDVIHSFGRLASLVAVFPTHLPKIMSYQRSITPRSIVWGRRLSLGRVTFAACSHRMLDDVRHLAPWRVIYNAVDVARYRFAPHVPADAPLVFLGRIEAIKGPHLAVDIARRSGRRLVLAGNVPDEHRGFFEEKIRPLVDGHWVEYIGPVDDGQKSELLSGASALLMPILWEEPFGIVMAEALACGTPVIGLRRGAVSEVVEEGVTGFVRDTPDELVEAVTALSTLDRTACRRAAEQRFSAEMLVDEHEALYEEVTR